MRGDIVCLRHKVLVTFKKLLFRQTCFEFSTSIKDFSPWKCPLLILGVLASSLAAPREFSVFRALSWPVWTWVDGLWRALQQLSSGLLASKPSLGLWTQESSFIIQLLLCGSQLAIAYLHVVTGTLCLSHNPMFRPMSKQSIILGHLSPSCHTAHCNPTTNKIKLEWSVSEWGSEHRFAWIRSREFEERFLLCSLACPHLYN